MQNIPSAPEPKFLTIHIAKPYSLCDLAEYRTVVNDIEFAGVEYLFTDETETQLVAYFKHSDTTNKTLNYLVNDESGEVAKILIKHLWTNKIYWGLAYE